MTIDEKLNLIAETLDADRKNINSLTVLKTLDEWDSMGTISIISMLDRKFGKVLTADEIAELKTVQDILDMMCA